MNNLSKDELIGDIAIIGMSGRFPKAKNLDEFWLNVRNGEECISIFSDEELLSAGVDTASINNPDYVRASAILEDIELFDASFFGFNPREAEIIDPQQRLFLECSWEAFENAGYDTESYNGLIGVYACSSNSSYLINNILSNQELIDRIGSYQIGIGNDKDQLPTRISYKLNLKGPSVAIQTACSSSLVAVVYACQSLLSYQCDIALAGGVSITVPQKTGYLYQEGMIASPDGHCRAFDAKAHGTVGGDGVGIVILKRLADALADGDCIRAVIKGSAINNDGSLKIGYTAPAVDGQAEVIAMAQITAKIKAGTISYVETHGTGTLLGDPIEVAALTKAFRASTDKKGFCAIGSVKTNIGHLDAAAGVAGLIKAILAIEHKLLPPSLHFEEPNPEIDFENSPFYVNTELSEWTAGEEPRRAGVSSFGIGGTNAHVIVEEAPRREPSSPSRPCQLLVLSAKTDTALTSATENLVECLKKHPDLNLADAAYTLQVGRRRLNNRRIVICQNPDEAILALDTLDPKRVYTAFGESDNRPVVFMFSGQGSQYVNMAFELYQTEPSFREQIDLCAELLMPHLGSDIREVLYPNEQDIEAASRRLTQTSMAQPALFVIEYALTELLAEWGIRPHAMIGHSIGEYVAACLAGVFSLEEALELVALRGRLIQELPGGAMLAIALGEKEVRHLLGKKLSLAAVNSPSLCVISGTEEAVDELQSELTARQISCRRLHTSHAFHSEIIDAVLPKFTSYLSKMNLRPPKMRYISNVTGTWINRAEVMDPAYWARHLRGTVRFTEGIAEFMKEPDTILLELGPGQTLGSLARQHPDKATEQVVLSTLRHPKEQESDVVFLLKTLGRLWLAGTNVDWTGFYREKRRHRIPLPTYSFEPQRYWVEPQKHKDNQGNRQLLFHKKPNIADWFYIPSWKRMVPPKIHNIDELGEKEGIWLIFMDECGVGAKIAKNLEESKQQVICVSAGEKFKEVDEGFYTINPQAPDDYGDLLKELRLLNKVPNWILHLWCITPNERREPNIQFCEKFQYLSFYSLLFISQGLGKNFVDDSIQILVISNNMQEVVGGELLCPEKATVLGACKIIPEEYQNIKCRSIDIVIPASDTKKEERMIDHLIAETIITAADPVVAYRGDYRWVEIFEHVQLDKTAEMTPKLKERGTYLITGGLGGMGFTIAEHLAKTLSAKLILTGRSAFPPRDKWKQWLENHDDQESTCQKIRKLQELEKLGAKFLIVSADVANLKQMQAVISHSEQIFGSINGVIHTAGIIDHGGVIQRRSFEQTTEVLAPKVTGTMVLDTIFARAELDFFVLCSSMGTVLYKSKFGEVSYCAANEFLDAFGCYRFSRNGSFTVTINWCDWSEVGMSVVAMDNYLETYGAKIEMTDAVSPSEGVDIFMRILGSEYTRVAVSQQDLGVAIEQEKSFLDIAHNHGIAKPAHSRPDLSTAYVAPRNELERTLTEIWQELLGIKEVGLYDNYFDLGGDSLLAAQIVRRIRDVLKVEIPINKFFEDASVMSLAETIQAFLWAKQCQLKASKKMQVEYEEI